jgi:hypothetical protein
MEAFLHPKQATGVVVQLAQAPAPWASPAPADYPAEHRLRRDGSGRTAPASLLRVTHAVPDLAPAVSLFVDLLGGTPVDEGSTTGSRWLDLSWGGPMGLRLLAPERPVDGVLLEWLGGRPGRVHHLELDVEEPDGIPDARRLHDGERVWIPGDAVERHRAIGSDDNAGLCLIVTDTA